MIGTLEVLSGYATKLDRLKQPVEFKPGLNILFGPNGCGKSTALKIAAAYSLVDEAGWSKFLEPAYLRKGDLQESLRNRAPGKCKAKVEWDGSPTLLADSQISDQSSFGHFFYSKEDSPDGMGSMEEQLQVMFGHPSAGQLRLKKLNDYYNSLKNPPIIDKVPNKKYNSTWMNGYKKVADYVCGLPRSGPVTFMMDEPDRSMSIDLQMLFWENFVRKATKDYQVIIATHCPFCLFHEDANWIEFVPGYIQKARQLMRGLADKIPK